MGTAEITSKDNAVNDGYRSTAPVGSYEDGKSPYGAYDMPGNVCEWVANWFMRTTIRTALLIIQRGWHLEIGPFCAAVGGPVARSMCVLHRRWYEPAYRSDFLGFRCAKTL